VSVPPPVIDASVLVKLFVPESGSEQAQTLMEETLAQYPDGPAVPDLIYAECGNVFWKKVQRGELTPKVAQACMTDLCALPMQVFPLLELAENALNWSLRYRVTVYDAVYAVLACAMDAPLYTADTALKRLLKMAPVRIEEIEG
jgi:predicted nucleic acid-binding protein